MMTEVEASQVDYLAHVVAMPPLLLIGLVGQSLNLFTLRHRSLNSAGFIYLRAGAVADIFSIFALVPFILRHAEKHWVRSYPAMWFHAHLELPIINSFLTAGTLCIVALTVDRYLSICHPMTAIRTINTTKKTHFIIFSLYAVAIAVFAPSAFQKEVVEEVDSSNRTYYLIKRDESMKENQVYQIYLMGREIIARLGPILVLVVLNAAITINLRRHAKRHRLLTVSNHRTRCDSRVSLQTGLPQPSPQPKRSRADVYESERRICVLLLITSITFIICNLPASLLSLVIGQSKEVSLKFQIFRAVANLLEVTSYFANFYCYALCSTEYRNAFLDMLSCRSHLTSMSTGESTTLKAKWKSFRMSRRRSAPQRLGVQSGVDERRSSVARSFLPHRTSII
uniref:G-protein coupled receptors family 1 profile domain-containing protein n=1 Tax=Plectus sambesii TaxID=2011161 RepID=A0A914WJB2_9BILA